MCYDIRAHTHTRTAVRASACLWVHNGDDDDDDDDVTVLWTVDGDDSSVFSHRNDRVIAHTNAVQ